VIKMIDIKTDETAVFALGGLDEVGKNTYCLEHNGEIIVIDAGIKFPSDDLLGVDYVIPDYKYLRDNADRIRCLIITHGHEDHIGGLPFMLKQLNIKEIYAPKLAKSLIEYKFEDRKISYDGRLIEYDENFYFKTDSFNISFFRTNHSIPDTFGIALQTSNGIIVHTGDFKFDFTPVGEPASIGKMAVLGERGVLCLLSDSTNAERKGFTKSEKVVDNALAKIFKKTEGRIIIATFASNVHRLKHIVDTAIRHGRKIAVAGRSMENAMNIAMKEGYVTTKKEDIIDIKDLKNYPMNEITILCTGSQGEPLAALSRIAGGTHRQIKLIPGDSVIFSSSPIPGNDYKVGNTINLLYRAGAKVYTSAISNTHTSGHGAQDELKLMLTLIKPKYFIPIHGEYRMQKIHGELGVSTGVQKRNVFILENGEVVAFNKRGARMAGRVQADDIYIDGKGIGDVGSVVIKDRRILSNEGIVIVSANVNLSTRKILVNPLIQSRGFIMVNQNEELVQAMVEGSRMAIEKAMKKPKCSPQDIKNKVSEAISEIAYRETNRRPIVMTVVMDINK
jgi:ribonuclease J